MINELKEGSILLCKRNLFDKNLVQCFTKDKHYRVHSTMSTPVSDMILLINDQQLHHILSKYDWLTPHYFRIIKLQK